MIPATVYFFFASCHLFLKSPLQNPKTELACSSLASNRHPQVSDHHALSTFSINAVFVHFGSVAIMAWCDKHHRALFVTIHDKELPGTTRVLYQVFSLYGEVEIFFKF